jgi:hypothetical protein
VWAALFDNVCAGVARSATGTAIRRLREASYEGRATALRWASYEERAMAFAGRARRCARQSIRDVEGVTVRPRWNVCALALMLPAGPAASDQTLPVSVGIASVSQRGPPRPGAALGRRGYGPRWSMPARTGTTGQRRHHVGYRADGPGAASRRRGRAQTWDVTTDGGSVAGSQRRFGDRRSRSSRRVHVALAQLGGGK